MNNKKVKMNNKINKKIKSKVNNKTMINMMFKIKKIED